MEDKLVAIAYWLIVIVYISCGVYMMAAGLLPFIGLLIILAGFVLIDIYRKS